MAERAEKNYYDILEVSPRAKVEVISASYTALRRFYAGDIQRVEELSKARKVLLDPTTRQEYDNQNRLEGMIVGKALYTGHIKFSDAKQLCDSICLKK